jgi:hypothetical protein
MNWISGFPTSSTVHPVFHVSQLKKVVSNSPVSTLLPDAAVAYQMPEAVLDTRVRQEGHKEVTQELVKWSHMGDELAT